MIVVLCILRYVLVINVVHRRAGHSTEPAVVENTKFNNTTKKFIYYKILNPIAIKTLQSLMSNNMTITAPW